MTAVRGYTPVGAYILPPSPAARRVVLAEEAHAEHSTYHDMRGRDRQLQLRSYKHGKGGGERHAKRAHRVHLGDLFTDDAYDAGAE